jgi:hypothetical protein
MKKPMGKEAVAREAAFWERLKKSLQGGQVVKVCRK